MNTELKLIIKMLKGMTITSTTKIKGLKISTDPADNKIQNFKIITETETSFKIKS